MSFHPPILMLAFVNPWFFWAGLGLAGIPIIIHLLNRRRFKIIKWAAMEYLLKALRKNRRRLRFEQWLLLAARCLVLAILGLALSRPGGCAESSFARLMGQQSGLSVLIIDNGLTMAYQANRPNAKTQLDQAKIVAKQFLDALQKKGGNEAIIIISTSGSAEGGSAFVIREKTYDLFDAKAAIDRIEQSYGRDDLAGAIDKAQKIATEETKQPVKTLYLVTDTSMATMGEKSVQAEALKSAANSLTNVYRMPINIFDLGQPNQWDYVVNKVDSTEGLVTTYFQPNLMAELEKHGDGGDAQLAWSIDGQPISGGQKLVFENPVEQRINQEYHFTEGGAHVLSVSIENAQKLKQVASRSRVMKVASKLPVLIVEGARGEGPLNSSGAFLNTALAPGSQTDAEKSDSYIATTMITELELSNQVLADYRAVVLVNVPSISEPDAQNLEKFVRDGGTLMNFMGEHVNLDACNHALLSRGLVPGKLVSVKKDDAADAKGYSFDFSPTGNIDPVLEPFKGQKDSGLETTRIYDYVQCDLKTGGASRIILKFAPPPGSDAQAAHDPAIVEDRLGDGRTVFFATGVDNNWSNLPAKPAFIALIHSLISGTVSVGDQWLNHEVGDRLIVPDGLKLTSLPSLVDPLKKQVDIHSDVQPNGTMAYQSVPLTVPGLYWLSTGSQTLPVAVNIDPAGTDVRVVSRDNVRKALGDVQVNFLGDSVPQDLLSHDDANDWGWFFMCCVLALVGLEAWMAMHFGHFRKLAGTNADQAAAPVGAGAST